MRSTQLDDREGPSVSDLALAGIAILLIAMSVVLFFIVEWWLAFIPLCIAGLLIIAVIFQYFRRAINDAETRSNIL